MNSKNKEPQFIKSLMPLIFLIMAVILGTVIVAEFRTRKKTSYEQPKSFEQTDFLAGTEIGGNVNVSEEPDIAGLLQRAMLCWERGDLAGAEDNFRTALVFRPNNQTALSHLGTIFMQRKEYGSAEMLFRQQVKFYPSFSGSHRNLALALYKLGRLQEAFATIKRACSLDPESEETFVAAARIALSIGKKEMAFSFLCRLKNTQNPLILELLDSEDFNSARNEKEFKTLRAEIEKSVKAGGNDKK